MYSMNILQELHDKLNESVIGNISSIANETSQDTNKALEQLSALFLGILTHEPITNQQVEKIQTVLEEGGHTGDLLDNLSFLLGDKQRASILVSIGMNIFNHFYTGDYETLTEKISIILGIKKSGIQTLLGLTPPLVLASLGRIIRREKMDAADLKSLLIQQQSFIKEWLSPYLIPQLGQSGIKDTVKIYPEPVSIPTEKARPIEEIVEGGKRKKVSKKPTLFQTILPWGLFFIAVFAAIIYLNGLTNPIQSNAKSKPTEVLPLLDDNSNLSFLDSARSETEPQSVNEKPQTVITNVTPANTEEPKPEVSPKTETKPIEEPKQRIKSTQNISLSAHSGVFKNTFEGNSAEIKEQKAIIDIFKKWQPNQTQTIDIHYIKSTNRLFEDQAYAIREALYQMGTPLKQIKLLEKNNLGSEKIKVAVQ